MIIFKKKKKLDPLNSDNVTTTKGDETGCINPGFCNTKGAANAFKSFKEDVDQQELKYTVVVTLDKAFLYLDTTFIDDKFKTMPCLESESRMIRLSQIETIYFDPSSNQVNIRIIGNSTTMYTIQCEDPEKTFNTFKQIEHMFRKKNNKKTRRRKKR